ncbi:MAG: hypothetical protein Q4A74_01575 [Cardiobacteriaceae bacterium]|nr:hypothetical protein [Cardiobacteriaceae bacterium]
MRNSKAAIAAIFLVLAGCTSRVEFVPSPARCPSMPPLPSVYESELQGLSDDAYQRLVERELRLKEYIGQLKVFCDE